MSVWELITLMLTGCFSDAAISQRSEREQEKGRVEAWVMNALQQMSRTEQQALNLANAEVRQAAINEEMRLAGASYVNYVGSEQRQQEVANSERYQALKNEAAKWQVEVSSAMQSQKFTHEQHLKLLRSRFGTKKKKRDGQSKKAPG